jgi:hypothetical protein
MTSRGIALALPVHSGEKYEYALSDNKKYSRLFFGSSHVKSTNLFFPTTTQTTASI